MNDLSCPKCGHPWRSFERNGITVDQCTGCGGVFLDRGELERLIEIESHYSEGRSFARAEELGYADRYRERYPSPFRHDDDDDDHRRHGYGHGRRRHRERGGFLEDFFGGDD
jgi:Zn-finger nucleic acid-binding protein